MTILGSENDNDSVVYELTFDTVVRKQINGQTISYSLQSNGAKSFGLYDSKEKAIEEMEWLCKALCAKEPAKLIVQTVFVEAYEAPCTVDDCFYIFTINEQYIN